MLKWLQEKYVAFKHLVRFCWSYIRYIIMFHMAKRSGIHSFFCDFTHATTSSLVIHSRFSDFMQRPVSCLSQNYSLVHKPRNLPNKSEFKSFEINHDYFPSMSAPNFQLSGGSLGYWTACNNFKRHCTLPYGVVGPFINTWPSIIFPPANISKYRHNSNYIKFIWGK